MALDPNTIVGLIVAAAAVFAKEFFAAIFKELRKGHAPAPVTTYIPDDAWKEFCCEQFMGLREDVKDSRETCHRIEMEQAVIKSQMNRIEIDHKNICTGPRKGNRQ